MTHHVCTLTAGWRATRSWGCRTSWRRRTRSIRRPAGCALTTRAPCSPVVSAPNPHSFSGILASAMPANGFWTDIWREIRLASSLGNANCTVLVCFASDVRASRTARAALICHCTGLRSHSRCVRSGLLAVWRTAQCQVAGSIDPWNLRKSQSKAVVCESCG